MTETNDIAAGFKAAIPIMLGYIAIGIPCGLLAASIGLNAFQVLIMSVLFYSGAGQFMIPNMWLAGSPMISIIVSISMVNTRQMLYSASLAQFCQKCKKGLAFIFAASVTDESFGVNIREFEQGGWDVVRATWVNVFSNCSWTLSNVVGCLVGSAISVPLAIASFAMTSIFICLTFTQKMSSQNIITIVGAFIGVFLFKLAGLSGFAIVGGALLGVVCGLLTSFLGKTPPEPVSGEAGGDER